LTGAIVTSNATMSSANPLLRAVTEEELEKIAAYATYEEFLDSQVTARDLNYVGDVNMARVFVELGYRGNRKEQCKEQFLAMKEEIERRKMEGRLGTHIFLSAGMVFEDDAMLRALQQREEANRMGKQASIIMIRDYNEAGQEISGYIDYAWRLATEDFKFYFNGMKKLLPNTRDLSFYNWESTHIYNKNTPNYELIANSSKGMMFLNKRDQKIVYVDPGSSPGDNSARTIVPAEQYKSVIIFDHYNRRRT